MALPVEVQLDIQAGNINSLSTLTDRIRALQTTLTSMRSQGITIDTSAAQAQLARLQTSGNAALQAIRANEAAFSAAGGATAEYAATIASLNAQLEAVRAGFYGAAASAQATVEAIDGSQVALRSWMETAEAGLGSTAALDASLDSVGESFVAAGAAAQTAAAETRAAVAEMAESLGGGGLGMGGAAIDSDMMLGLSMGAGAGSKTQALKETEADLQRVSAAGMGAGNAMNFLGRAVGVAFFKFIEYQVVLGSIIGSIWGLGEALKFASDVQQEMTLQKLYGGIKDTNAALKDAIVLAEHWGDSIQDVQQTIGTWSKVTHDQATAEFLTNEALKAHLVSGIATNDLTQTTISLMQKWHLTAGALPGVLDQVTKAAELMALPMKNLGTTSGTQEGFREMLEGASEAGATLKAEGFTNSQILAVIMGQIQGLNQSGKEAGHTLATMFSGLEVNKSGATFDSIIAQTATDLKKIQDITGGPITTGGNFFEAITGPNGEKIAQELYNAIKKGTITVRPQVKEALMNMLASAGLEAGWAKILEHDSKGALDVAAQAMLGLFQTHIQQFEASLSALGIDIGSKLLPVAQEIVDWLGNKLFPWLEKNDTEILHVAEDTGKFLAVLTGFSILAGIANAFNGLFTAIMKVGAAQVAAATTGKATAGAIGLEGEVAVAATPGLNVFGAGLKGIALNAINAYGPIIVLTGAIWGLVKAHQGWVESQQRTSANAQEMIFTGKYQGGAQLPSQVTREAVASAGEVNALGPNLVTGPASEAAAELEKLTKLPQTSQLGNMAREVEGLNSRLAAGTINAKQYGNAMAGIETEWRHMRPQGDQTAYDMWKKINQANADLKKQLMGSNSGAAAANPDPQGLSIGNPSKTPADAIINIGNHTAEQITSMAANLETKLKAAGANIKDGSIDLVNGMGEITRIQGNAHIVEMVLATLKKQATSMGDVVSLGSHSASQVETMAAEIEHHLRAAKKHIDDGWIYFVTDSGQVVDRVKGNAKIMEMAIASITKINKDLAAASKSSGTATSVTARLSGADSDYQTKLQAIINLQKNQELPTLKELFQQYQYESTYRKQLVADLDKETTARTALGKQIDILEQDMRNLASRGEENTVQYHNLSNTVATLTTQYQQMDAAIIVGQGNLNQLDISLGTLQTTMNQVADAAYKMRLDIVDSLTAGVKSGLTGVFDEMDNAFKKFFQRTFAGGGVISTFIKQVFQGALNEAMGQIQTHLVQSFQNMFSHGLGVDTSQNPAAALKDSATALTKAAGDTFKVHQDKIYPVHQRIYDRHHLASQELIAAANALKGSASKSSSPGFGSPYQVASADTTMSDVVFGGNPQTNDTYVFDQMNTSLKSIDQNMSDASSATKDMANGTKGGGSGAFGSIFGFSGLTGGAATFWGQASGAAGQGMGLGTLFGTLMQGGDSGSHEIWGQIAGGIGGILGTAFGGPAGGEIGSTVGALFGSLFGNTVNPQQTPDVSGVPGIGMSPQQYQQYLGLFNSGKGDVLESLSKFISYSGSEAGMNPQQKALFDQLKAWGGGTPGGLAIQSESQGMFTLQSGAQVPVQQFIQDTTMAQKVMQELEKNMLTSAENAAALQASFISSIINGPAGFTMAGLGASGFAGNAPGITRGPVIGPPVGGGGMYGGNLVPPVGTTLGGGNGMSAPPGSGEIHLHLLEGATISQDLEAEIMKALPNIKGALAATLNEINYNNNRLTGNFVPVL